MPEGRINVTDPDSRVMRTHGQPTIQGYNAQAAVTENQIIIAAEITIESPDFGHLEPVFDAALRNLERAGVSDRPGIVVAFVKDHGDSPGVITGIPHLPGGR